MRPSLAVLRRRLAVFLLAWALGAFIAGPLRAAAITLEPVLAGLSSPILVTHAGDGSDRLFVVEQGGVIRIHKEGVAAPTTFLDISDRVVAGGERGLLGLAFHPAYAVNRRFFVNYTRRADGATVVAEYAASAGDPEVADRTEIVLLTIAQPFANHNGGMIAFGPDGYLFIGMGDGGSANDPGQRAQNMEELLGKMLRIDVDHPASPTQLYSSPADNPFVGLPGRDEIYASGFRNPWRFSFDRETGDLLAGDVGQGSREEIDRVVRGGNYGWRTYEGTLCTGLDLGMCDPTRFVMPIAEYGHSIGRCSVTGGYVYRGVRGSLPTGSYVFGDFCTGEMFLLENGQVGPLAAAGVNISSFGQDRDGELYVVGLGGTVHRIVSASPCDFASIAPERQPFPASGGTGVVNVITGDGCPWETSGGADWITVVEGAAGAGDGTVRYEVAVNATERPRTATLIIAGRAHTVTQAATRRCLVTLGTTFARFGVAGGTGSVPVAARPDCQWSAASSADWLAITSGPGGVGNGVVLYRVDANRTGRPRFGLLRIGGRFVVVVQR